MAGAGTTLCAVLLLAALGATGADAASECAS